MLRMMSGAFSYRVESGDGGYLVQFVDVPEAHTSGKTGRRARAAACDCLIAALGGYLELRRAIPGPSVPRGRPAVELPALVAAKLALYQAMRDQRVTRVALASKLGVTEGAVRKLLDLDHQSHIRLVEAALEALGQKLVVEVRRAA